MKTNIIYSLISNGVDNYTEQLCISSYTLKHYNSDAHVLLVTDEKTLRCLNSNNQMDLLKYVDEIVKVEIDSSFNGVQRSRQLKTSIRNIVDGDYLFIDTDTLINSDISEIDNYDIEFGAVYDGHNIKSPSFSHEKKMLIRKLFGRDVVFDNYFNSGIIYVKDTIKNRDFYKKWNEVWLSSKKEGVYYDQIPLAITNTLFDNHIKAIPYYFNTQVNVCPVLYITNSKILHLFYGSNKTLGIINTLGKYMDNIYDILKDKRHVDDEIGQLAINWKDALKDQIVKYGEIERTPIYDSLVNVIEKKGLGFLLLRCLCKFQKIL